MVLVMSEEQLKAFQAAIQADNALQEKLKTAGDADAVVAIAKAAGFLISAEELQRAQAEISEEELEDVAGGRNYHNACLLYGQLSGVQSATCGWFC